MRTTLAIIAGIATLASATPMDPGAANVHSSAVPNTLVTRSSSRLGHNTKRATSSHPRISQDAGHQNRKRQDPPPAPDGAKEPFKPMMMYKSKEDEGKKAPNGKDKQTYKVTELSGRNTGGYSSIMSINVTLQTPDGKEVKGFRMSSGNSLSLTEGFDIEFDDGGQMMFSYSSAWPEFEEPAYFLFQDTNKDSQEGYIGFVTKDFTAGSGEEFKVEGFDIEAEYFPPFDPSAMPAFEPETMPMEEAKKTSEDFCNKIIKDEPWNEPFSPSLALDTYMKFDENAAPSAAGGNGTAPAVGEPPKLEEAKPAEGAPAEAPKRRRW
ncbi:Hypothetical protein D9617_20g028290 [Elsinoe fawcettii]|nr:Hypothetical protein D9617_20g028290 [Elsinoe fawcettii]